VEININEVNMLTLKTVVCNPQPETIAQRDADMEVLKPIYEALKENQDWLNKFVMKFYIQASNPTYEKMRLLYQELNDFAETIGSEALNKAEGK